MTLPGPLTRDEALAIVRSACSPDDMAAIERSPEGQAMLAMVIDPLVELSAKLDRSVTARHLVQRRSDVSAVASGATKARATVSVARTRVGPALTLPARNPSCVVVTADGHRYELETAVTFEPGNAGPKTVSVEAVVAGFGSTAIAGRIAGFLDAANGASGDVASVTVNVTTTQLVRGAGDRFLETFVGLYVEFTGGVNAGRFAQITSVLSTESVLIAGTGLVDESNSATWAIREWAELGVVVSQSADSTQGTDDELDARAAERGRRRQTGETDESLRIAILALSDVVSPLAILRLCNRVLGAYGPVRMYETGTAEWECDSSIGLEPFPGFVFGLTPWSAPVGTLLLTQGAAPPAAPPRGLCVLSRATRFFLLRWDGYGLGDPGGYLKDSTGVAQDDPVPRGFAFGVSPWSGEPFGDHALRAALSDAVRIAKAGGVGWTWYPRRF